MRTEAIVSRPSWDGTYLRRYNSNDAIRILDNPDDNAAATALDFQSWAERHQRQSQPAMIEEFALAFVRFYRQQWRVLAHSHDLIARFNKTVDALEELRDAAAGASSAGDSSGAHISRLVSLLLERPAPVHRGKIQRRDPDSARQLLGAFADRRKARSAMGAPWSPTRRCAHALAQAWHRAFRELPRGGSEVKAYLELLCSIVPEDNLPDEAIAHRCL
jgi:hypothetical protein